MPKINSLHHKKRHGRHHTQGKHYQKVYLPYLPAVVMLITALMLSGLKLPSSQTATLAYATEISQSSLLQSTNQQRTSNSKTNLKLNQKLSAAAQAKANDMSARNYWAHNTPDGQEPWVFVDKAGYAYQKAGENLAYGFPSSSQTVVGWMNSASHKANLLDDAFSEVGFGFANASNFQSKGEETIVVAMYGQPLADPEVTGLSPITPPAGISEPSLVLTQEQPVNSTGILAVQPAEKQISRIQSMTGGHAPWALFAVGLMAGMAITGMFINHGLRLRKLLQQGEMLVLHHPAFDVNMLSLLALALTLSDRIGVIL